MLSPGAELPTITTMLRTNFCISNRSYGAKQPSLCRGQHRVSSVRITHCSGGGGATAVSSSSRLRDLVFVVNPQGVCVIPLTYSVDEETIELL